MSCAEDLLWERGWEGLQDELATSAYITLSSGVIQRPHHAAPFCTLLVIIFLGQEIIAAFLKIELFCDFLPFFRKICFSSQA